MIARVWHGAVPAAKSDDYLEYLTQTGVPGLSSTPGNCGVQVLRRTKDDLAHFLLISLWDSPESIKTFAGGDIEKARYYPEDAQFLVEMEPAVIHYDVVVDNTP